MTPHGLIQAARVQAEPGRHGHPTQPQLRRAASTAYYAMFHILAAAVADLVVGERNPEWHRACRALEHSQARKACQQVRTMREVPADIREFASVFGRGASALSRLYSPAAMGLCRGCHRGVWGCCADTGRDRFAAGP